jgi:hypothetical protein
MNETKRLKERKENAYTTWQAAYNNPAVTGEEEQEFFNSYRAAANAYAEWVDNDWLKV